MFHDRKDAGVQLAERLKHYKDAKEAVVLALPRGGAVTAYEIASALNIPLDVLIVRKIGFPGEPELAIGAVSETGVVVLNKEIISAYGVSEEYIRDEISKQKEEILRRVKVYRGGRKIGELKNKTIILVDDGVATGATMKAAIATLRKEKIKKLVVALPVAPPETAEELKKIADEFICVETPFHFTAIGAHYRDFTQVSDSEVEEILRKSLKLTEKRARKQNEH